jgi:hypothetical protein
MEINKPGDLGEIAHLGLSPAEAKLLLAGVQREIVAAQARAHAVRRTGSYDSHAFGQVTVRLLRFRYAACRAIEIGIDWPSHCRSTPDHPARDPGRGSHGTAGLD